MAEARTPDWLTVHDALARILAAARATELEDVPLGDACGRILAEAIVSPIDHPPWDNSAMDGFAVRAADIGSASRERPVYLTLIGAVAAGDRPTAAVTAGTAVAINTGAPIPDGADTVVRIEHTDQWRGSASLEVTAEQVAADARTVHPDRGAAPEGGRRIAVFDAADARKNVRRSGEDLRRGAQVFSAGRHLSPADIGVLASVGSARVRVYRRARVGILSNGNELADLSDFDAVLAGDRIVNSNSYALAAAVRATGAEPVLLGIAADTRESLRRHLEKAAGLDALITTAGASVGEHDLIKSVLEEMGYESGFWRVKIQPGSPFSFGHLRGRPVFGLAGNPVSALVTFELLVRPALRRMMGRADVYPAVLPVRAGERIESRAGLMRFLRVRLSHDGGALVARLTGPQGSGILTSIAEADALLVVPTDQPVIEAGQEMLAVSLRSGDAASATFDL